MEDIKVYLKPNVSRLLADISRFLTEEGIRSYIVGGFVRDTLLGRVTADIDFAVDGDVPEIAPRIAEAVGGRYVQLNEENGVGRVVLLNHQAPAEGRWELDFATLKGNIEHDLAQRDFTIDAMAIELEDILIHGALDTDNLIDPFSGQDDLNRGVLRAVSETAFKSDAARLLRAVRLAAELGFSIDSRTEALITEDSHLIASVAGERIREELLRVLALPRAGQLLAYLGGLGLLTVLIPELAVARGVSQPKVHVWDIYDHSVQTVSALEFLLREGSWEYAGEDALNSVPWPATLKQYFDQEVSSCSTRRSLLKLAALLHDIAKPQTKTIGEDGRARFLGHPQEGAAAAVSILERLRFSTREIKLVEIMVQYHLRPTQMTHEEFPSQRAIYRYFRDTGEAGIEILFLSLADHLATRGTYLDMVQWQEHTQIVEYVLTKHLEEESLSAPPKLVDGHDLINILGLSPGPRLGKLLEAIREAQAAGELTTRQDALYYVKSLLADQAQNSPNESTQGEK